MGVFLTPQPSFPDFGDFDPCKGQTIFPTIWGDLQHFSRNFGFGEIGSLSLSSLSGSLIRNTGRFPFVGNPPQVHGQNGVDLSFSPCFVC